MRRLLGISLVLFLIFSAGCMKLGPDFTGAGPGPDLPDRFENAPGGQAAGELPGPWWRSFNDPKLERIVTNVLEKNPDIQAAASRVMAVAAVARQTGSDRYPELNLSAYARRQRQKGVDLFTGAVGLETRDSFGLSLPASFELDLWGRLARASEAARADLLAAEENRRTVVLSMVAEAVDLYLQIASLKHRIRLEQEIIDIRRQRLELLEDRYRRGLADILAVQQVRQGLVLARTRLPDLVEAMGKSRQALSILQGEYPTAKDKGPQPPEGFKPPLPIPPGLPADLLKQRPDIRAAEAALHAAMARIGVAKAARFPAISLTGSFGYASDGLKDLFKPESELWEMATGGMQPVFNAGRLAAGQKAAEAAFAEARADYAKTLLSAFAEVEGALLSRKEQVRRWKHFSSLIKEAEASLAVTSDRYRRGLVDYLSVLDAREALFNAQLELIQAEYAILSNRVRLCRALGGGWDKGN